MKNSDQIALAQRQPTFFPVETFRDAFFVTEERFHLNRIAALTPQALGLDEAHAPLAESIKTVITLLTHDFLHAKQAWARVQDNYMDDQLRTVIKKRLGSFSTDLLFNIFNLTAMITNEDQNGLNVYFAAKTALIIDPMQNMIGATEALLFPVDQVDYQQPITDLRADVCARMKAIILSGSKKIAHQIAAIGVKIECFLNELLMNLIQHGSDRFDYRKINRVNQNRATLTDLEHASLKKAEIKQFLNFHEAYLNIHQEAEQLFVDTVAHIDQICPGVTPALFEACYANALDQLKRQQEEQKEAYLLQFCYELYLTENRYPHISQAIYPELVTILSGIKMHFDDFLTMAMQERVVPLSLPEYVKDAYTKLGFTMVDVKPTMLTAIYHWMSGGDLDHVTGHLSDENMQVVKKKVHLINQYQMKLNEIRKEDFLPAVTPMSRVEAQLFLDWADEAKDIDEIYALVDTLQSYLPNKTLEAPMNANEKLCKAIMTALRKKGKTLVFQGAPLIEDLESRLAFLENAKAHPLFSDLASQERIDDPIKDLEEVIKNRARYGG